jgi:radical SAM PhpK family P-methyltransferase
MDFVEYEQQVRKMGLDSGAYRDLNLNFIWYNNTPYPVSEIFNSFYCTGGGRKSLTPPLRMTEVFSPAIAYLGSYLHRRGIGFDFVNSFQLDKNQLQKKLIKDNIRAIAIVTTFYVSVFPILEIMDFLKAYNSPAKIIIGGPFVANQVRTQDAKALQYLFNTIGADFYVNSSQGEAALIAILHALKNNLPVSQINNIYYKTGVGSENRYMATPSLEENNPLHQNMVNWDLFAHKLGKSVNVRTSISCPFSCDFCGFPQQAGKYQTVDPEAVEIELNQLDKIDSVTSVQFIDDTFNVPQGRFKEILRMMIKNKYRFRWHSHFRCQFADKETVELMKESGCEGIFLGIESGNDQMLKNMNKAVSVHQYLRGIQWLKKYDIPIYGSFIIGFPGETEQSVRDTTKFIKESGIDFYRAQLWYCKTGTPVWLKREEYKIEGESFQWRHKTMDSRQAADLIDEIFLSLEGPTWVPQYNFECDGLFHLLHRGLTLDRIKRFIKGFNQGIKEKLINRSTRQEISFEALTYIKEILGDRRSEDSTSGPGKDGFDKYDAEFDL